MNWFYFTTRPNDEWKALCVVQYFSSLIDGKICIARVVGPFQNKEGAEEYLLAYGAKKIKDDLWKKDKGQTSDLLLITNLFHPRIYIEGWRKEKTNDPNATQTQ
jgi:hypothetical protein